jgi:hypothetical protein
LPFPPFLTLFSVNGRAQKSAECKHPGLFCGRHTGDKNNIRVIDIPVIILYLVSAIEKHKSKLDYP